MLDVFTVTLPIYLIIALGYFTLKFGLFDTGIVDYLAQFVVKLAIPLLVFLAITSAGQGSVLVPELMLGFAALTLSFLFIGRAILRYGLGERPGQSWSLALGIANPNSIMIGFPLAVVMFPDYSAPIFASILLTENLTAIPLSVLLAEMSGRNSRGFKAAMADLGRSFARNSILMAVVAALTARAVGYAPSGPIEQTIRLIGQTATGLALFYIGAVCTRSNFTGPIPTISVIAILKLVAMPLIAAVFFPLLLDDPTLTAAAIMISATPMLTIYPILARQSGAEDVAATVLIVTTTLSFFTVSATLMLL